MDEVLKYERLRQKVLTEWKTWCNIEMDMFKTPNAYKPEEFQEVSGRLSVLRNLLHTIAQIDNSKQ